MEQYSDILGRFFSFFISAIVFFIVPIMLIALKQDDTKQTMIDDAVVEFVDNARAAGQIKYDDYMNLYKAVGRAQEKCKIEITYKSVYQYPKIEGAEIVGYERYYRAYNNQDIMSVFDSATTNEARAKMAFELKDGGYLNVHVVNTAPTLGTRMFRLFVPMYAGRTLSSSYGGYVGNNKQ